MSESYTEIRQTLCFLEYVLGTTGLVGLEPIHYLCLKPKAKYVYLDQDRYGTRSKFTEACLALGGP